MLSKGPTALLEEGLVAAGIFFFCFFESDSFRLELFAGFRFADMVARTSERKVWQNYAV